MLQSTLRCPCHRAGTLLLLLLLREAPASCAIAHPHPRHRALVGARPVTGAAGGSAAAGRTLLAARRFHQTVFRASEPAAGPAPAAEESSAGAPDGRADGVPTEQNPQARATKTRMYKEFRLLKAELAAAESAYAAGNDRHTRPTKPGAAPTFAPVEKQWLKELKAAVKAAKAAAKGKPMPPTGDEVREGTEACPTARTQGYGAAPPKYLKTWGLLVKRGLHEQLAENAKRRGWPQPLTIQERIIPDILQGYNVVASAKTGEGKTAAFVLPVLHHLLAMKAAGEAPKLFTKELLIPQAIVLTPTAELSRQIADEINNLAVGLPLRAAAIYQTGEPIDVQFRRARKADIIVGTAGRILSHVQGPTSHKERIRKVAASKWVCEDEDWRTLGNEADADIFGDGDNLVPVEHESGGQWTISAQNVGHRPHQKSYVLLGGVRFLVLDECDKLCSPEHLPDVLELFKLLPPVSKRDLTKEKERLEEKSNEPQFGEALQELYETPSEITGPTMQVIVTSATLSREVHHRILNFAPMHKVYDMNRAMNVPPNIRQIVFSVTNRHKFALLRHLLMLPKDTFPSMRDARVLVFCRTSMQAEKVTKYLEKTNFDARCLHADFASGTQRKIIDEFKDDDFKILVATDIAMRGLDIPNIDYVVNLYVPHIPEDYLHRVGRTGRAGAPGTAITFVGKHEYKARMETHVIATIDEEQNIRRIARFLNGGKRADTWRPMGCVSTTLGEEDAEDAQQLSALERLKVPGNWVDVGDPGYVYHDVPDEVREMRKARNAEKVAERKRLREAGSLGSLPSPNELTTTDYARFTRARSARKARRYGVEVHNDDRKVPKYLLGEKACRSRLHFEKMHLANKAKALEELMKARKAAAESFAKQST